MNGVLLVDKGRGMTSHDVVNRLRRILQIKRIGHTGTLDPDATGLLVVCIGQATRVSSLLMGSDKTYEVEFRLGETSDTYDSTGKTVSTKEVNVDEAELRKTLRSFVGVRMQVPPQFSAVKIGGKKLYEYARKGEKVEAPPREITIYSLGLTSFESPVGKVWVECSKGTFVRSLIHEVGECLGAGAVTTSIRRLRSGHLNLGQAVTLDEIEPSENPKKEVESRLQSISRVLSALPTLRVNEENLPRILHGAGLRASHIAACKWMSPVMGEADPVLIVSEEGEAIALGAYDAEANLKVKRVLTPTS